VAFTYLKVKPAKCLCLLLVVLVLVLRIWSCLHHWSRLLTRVSYACCCMTPQILQLMGSSRVCLIKITSDDIGGLALQQLNNGHTRLVGTARIGFCWILSSSSSSSSSSHLQLAYYS